PRSGWDTIYVSVGSVPGFLASRFSAFSANKVEKLLSDTAIFRSKARAGAPDVEPDCEFIVQIAQKLIQRGLAPLPTLELESVIARDFEARQLSIAEPESPEVGWTLIGAVDNVSEQGLISALTERLKPFKPEQDIDVSNAGAPGFDSERERVFAFDLLPEINPALTHWLHAQVPFRQLVVDDAELAAARRADFLISHPF